MLLVTQSKKKKNCFILAKYYDAREIPVVLVKNMVQQDTKVCVSFEFSEQTELSY